MKKLFILLMHVFFSLNLLAQADVKNDVILKVNGDELKGKVTEITDSIVKFTYAGETLVYSIKKSDILKITYASGRVEIFNKQPIPSEQKNDMPDQKTNLVDHRNRVAILPFRFISDKQSTGDDMSYQVQSECYAYLSKHAGELTILDPRTTNALLIKAGATFDKMMGFTMGELCDILSVEYVVDGTVTQNKSNQSTYQNDSYKASSSTDNKSGQNKGKVTGSSSSTTTQNYQTNLGLNIYTDKNTNIYSQQRTSIWNTTDAYKNTLEYLLKRTPLYRK